ncbi:MAG: hypothetical protein M1825_005515 [Sarcosagium campestre]|nr:MAG: hypothetical protein M1825_005515 [Sarcosagium campestre]
MDFPLHCPTNYLQQEGFFSIPYRVYDVDGTTRLQPLHDVSLHRTEQTLRSKRVLCTIPTSTNELWIFGRGEGDSTLTGFPLEGEFGLNEIRQGTIESRTLDKQIVSVPKKRSGPTPTSSSETTSRSTQASTITRPHQVNKCLSVAPSDSRNNGDEDDCSSLEDETQAIYELFIAAVTSALSFILTKDFGYIPFGFRNLIVPHQAQSDGRGTLKKRRSCVRPALRIATLDIKLTSSGTLLLGQRVSEQPELYSLSLLPRARLGLVADEQTFWLAPGGLPVRSAVAAVDDDQYALSTDFRSFDAVAERERAKGRWRLFVLEWLSGHGISVDSAEWVNVETLLPVAQTTSQPQTRRGSKSEGAQELLGWRSFTWPRELCYRKRATHGRRDPPPLSSSEAEGGQGKAGGKLASYHHGGVKDPIELVAEWFRSKDDRTARISAKADAIRAQQVSETNARADAAVVTTKESTMRYRNSVSYASHVGDLQGVNSVYPTPPDGLPTTASGATPGMATGATPSNNSVSNVNTIGSSDNIEAITEEQASDIDMNMWPSVDGAEGSGPVDAARKASTTSAFGTVDEGTTNLFGDMDEEMFNDGNGVTEADFSFFDEPDFFGEGSTKPTHTSPPEVSDGKMEVETAEMKPSNEEAVIEDVQDTTPLTIKLESPKVADDVKMEDIDLAAVKETRQVDTPQSTIDAPDLLRLASSPKVHQRALSPPLSPAIVRKKLLPMSESERDKHEMYDAATTTANRNATVAFPPPRGRQQEEKSGLFKPMIFNGNVAASHQKYDSDGRFWFGSKDHEASPQPDLIPRIGLPSRKRGSEQRRPEGKPAHGHATSAAKKKVATNHDVVNSGSRDSSDEDDEDDDSSIDSSFENVSDEEDTSDTETNDDEAFSLAALGLKRKRDSEDDGDVALSSLKRLAFEPSPAQERSAADPASFDWRLVASDPADWSMAGYFGEEAEGQYQLELDVTGQEFIEVAQIVTAQATSTTFGASLSASSSHQSTMRRGDGCQETRPSNRLHTIFAAAAQQLLSRVSRCNLGQYATVRDVTEDTSLNTTRPGFKPNPNAARQANGDRAEPASPSASLPACKLDIAQVVIQRAESSLTVLPPALDFWEPFGFSPYSGAKDVTSICLHPSSEAMEKAADRFLDSMSTTYEACKLGKHGRIESGGLCPIDWGNDEAEGDGTSGKFLSNLTERFVRIGKDLRDFREEKGKGNIVLYVINPSTDPRSLVELCTAHMALSRAYDLPGDEIILSILPLSFVAFRDNLVVPKQRELQRLAFETYEKCAITSKGRRRQRATLANPAPSMCLAESPPETIDFRLSADPPVSLLHENRSIHLAYACSTDDRWVTAAWTDELGRYQHCVSYCRARPKQAGSMRPFAHIARELWETTIWLVQAERANWRFLVSRSGVMSSVEMDAWTSLAASTPSVARSLVLLSTTTDTDVPTSSSSLLELRRQPLEILVERGKPAGSTTGTSGTASTAGTVGTAAVAQQATPASTPAPNANSPEHQQSPAAAAAAAANATVTATAAAAAAVTPGTTSSGAANAPTPSSTTDAGGTSPGTPAVPPELDPEATLIDATDETWAVLLGHRCQNAHSIVEYRPALSSGYLVRRCPGPAESDVPTCVGVNLLYVQKHQHSYQNSQQPPPPQQQPGREKDDRLLLEILRMYADLTILAKAKTLGDPANAALPWHVAAANRGALALGRLM